MFISAYIAFIYLSHLFLLGSCQLGHELRNGHVSRAPTEESSNRSIDWVSNRQLTRNVKRDGGSARFTYFATGLGACGTYNKPTDFIVAINTFQWDGGSHCYEKITISYGGKTTQAQIVDLCEGCPYDGLDFSLGLFTFFAPASLGVLYGDWSFGASSTKATPTKTKTSSLLSLLTPSAKLRATHEPMTSSKSGATSKSALTLPVSSTIQLSLTKPTRTASANASSTLTAVETTLSPSDQPQNIASLNKMLVNYAGLLHAPSQSYQG